MNNTDAADTSLTPAGPPLAERRAFVRTHHGDSVTDPYAWLSNPQDPAVIAYLEAENAWTEGQTADLADLREELYQSIAARTKQTDVSVPTHVIHGDLATGGSQWWYYSRTVEGMEYSIHCRVPADGPDNPPDPETTIGGEVILLDGNVEAEGHKFFALGTFDVSPDGRLLAYSVDTTGAERYTLTIKDLATGEHLPDIIDNTFGTAWAGNSELFYTQPDPAWRPWIVKSHVLGTAADTDREVFAEPDERFWVSLTGSRDERWILIGSGSKLSSEWRILSTDHPAAEPRIICPRRDDIEYDVEVAGDRLLIVHNTDALDYMVSQAPLDATSAEQWETVLPHTPGVRITDVDAYQGFVVVGLRRDGLTGIHVIPRDGEGNLLPGRDVSFDQPVFTVSSLGSPTWDTDRVRVGFTSLVSPATTYDLDLASLALTELRQQPVLPHPTYGPFDPSQYEQVRLWARAEDGTDIPISLIQRVGTPRDGSAPLVLYGYGSYEISIDPSFSISRLSYLDHGCSFAIAHVRGGGEMGRAWYDHGKMLSKRNTFSDFIACAHYLIDQGWTSAERLGAVGGSAGGLLMGAVANQAPQTFRAIHAAVPFVDALTTILDPEMPLTVTEWDEWGNPLADPEVYAYMKSYTPYENVQAVPYPAILATTSLNDTRVSYAEPAKWIAQLRALTPPGRSLLLRTEMVAGHGGVSGRYARWRDIAFEDAWLINEIAS